jgi:hypothetical protein
MAFSLSITQRHPSRKRPSQTPYIAQSRPGKRSLFKWIIALFGGTGYSGWETLSLTECPLLAVQRHSISN